MSGPGSATGAPLDASTSGQNDPKGNWWTRSGLAVRIALAALAVAIGLAIVFLVMFLAITGLRHRSLEARHSQQVIASANRLQTLLIELEAKWVRSPIHSLTWIAEIPSTGDLPHFGSKYFRTICANCFRDDGFCRIR